MFDYTLPRKIKNMNHCNTAVTEPVITPWPHNKRWAYSITFDEGLVELHQFSIPILA